jgi:quercetin dioxygenase-like cupin family protein
MLTRRIFANCAICAAMTLVATGAEAQTAAPAFQRVMLKQIDGPAEGYTTILMRVDVEPGALIARHTHPGIETGYLLSGAGTLTVQKTPLQLSPGDSYQVPTGAPHLLQNGNAPSKILASFTVEKGKPLATPAPE